MIYYVTEHYLSNAGGARVQQVTNGVLATKPAETAFWSLQDIDWNPYATLASEKE
jgi:hypothetical protein